MSDLTKEEFEWVLRTLKGARRAAYAASSERKALSASAIVKLAEEYDYQHGTDKEEENDGVHLR